MIERKLFVCECGDTAHQFIISKFVMDDSNDADLELSKKDPEFFETLYISVKLNREFNIFKRIWHALKYVFGRPSIYGDFDEVLLNKKEKERLINILSN